MITPMDLENKRFSKKRVNGYNVEEVDDFLDDLIVDYTKNYKEVTELRGKVVELENAMERYKKIEETIQSTLLMAQTAAEEAKKIAHQQAEQIISEAKCIAQKQVNDLENEIKIKRSELESIKKQFDVYKAKMESLLISQLELLKETNREDI